MVLKKKQEIERILKSGNQVRGRVFNAFINQADKTRVAFLIDKHVGNAVQRNKMKRLVREAFRLNKNKFNGNEIVFYIKKYKDDFKYIFEKVKNLN